MNALGVHTDLGEVVDVDVKVEEDIGEDELEGWQQHCHDYTVTVEIQIGIISIFSQTHRFVHKIINFLMGSHCGKLVLHSEILGYEGLEFWSEDNL